MTGEAPALRAFKAWCRAEGWTQDRLAYECDCNRSHVSLVLSGARPGRYTWRRMVKVLPEHGLLLLQQCPTWNTHAAQALVQRREREQLLKIAKRCGVEVLA